MQADIQRIWFEGSPFTTHHHQRRRDCQPFSAYLATSGKNFRIEMVTVPPSGGMRRQSVGENESLVHKDIRLVRQLLVEFIVSGKTEKMKPLFSAAHPSDIRN